MCGVFQTAQHDECNQECINIRYFIRDVLSVWVFVFFVRSDGARPESD